MWRSDRPVTPESVMIGVPRPPKATGGQGPGGPGLRRQPAPFDEQVKQQQYGDGGEECREDRAVGQMRPEAFDRIQVLSVRHGPEHEDSSRSAGSRLAMVAAPARD